MQVAPSWATPDINLLPWRAVRRVALRQRFTKGCLLSLLATLAMLLIASQLLAKNSKVQKSRLHLLESHLAQLDTKLARAPSVRASVAQYTEAVTQRRQLLTSRPQTLYQLLLLATSWTEGVRLQKIRRQGSALVLTGTTTGNAAVARLIGYLEKTNAFAEINLNRIHKHESAQQDQDPLAAYFFEVLLRVRT